MNEERFTGKAQLYAKYRPSYPDTLVDWIFAHTRAQTVADIGAGTGIFTKCLLKKPWQVTAVEPNADMLSELRQTVGDSVNIVKASAENTGLNPDSVDLITVAQAFHWFDKAKFQTECKRILHKNGKLAVIWNERLQSGIAETRNEICMNYCGNYHSGFVHTGYADFDGDTFLRNEYFRTVDFFSVKNPYFMTKEQFIGDNLSRSYALAESDAHYADFISELEAAFDTYCIDGVVEQSYLSTCYLGTF